MLGVCPSARWSTLRLLGSRLKLLIDENLPIALGKGLGMEILYATEIGSRLSDIQLWDEAIKGNRVLVTKDADFFDRLALYGSPPKIIWVRFGNMRRKTMESLFASQWPKISQLLEINELVELFADRIEGISFSR